MEIIRMNTRLCFLKSRYWRDFIYFQTGDLFNCKLDFGAKWHFEWLIFFSVSIFLLRFWTRFILFFWINPYFSQTFFQVYCFKFFFSSFGLPLFFCLFAELSFQILFFLPANFIFFISVGESFILIRFTTLIYLFPIHFKLATLFPLFLFKLVFPSFYFVMLVFSYLFLCRWFFNF